MAEQGYGKVMIRTVDTDVVVIAVAKVMEIGLDELWVLEKTTDTLQYTR